MRRLLSFIHLRSNLLGLGLVLFFVVVALAAPHLAPLDVAKPRASPGEPYQTTLSFSFKKIPLPPNRQALLGTNSQQYDIFYSLIWGTRSALCFSLIVCLLAASIGILVGAASGYGVGWLNRMGMHITNGFLAFPLLAGYVILVQFQYMAWAAVVGPRMMELYIAEQAGFLALFIYNLDPLMIALILFSWMPYARMVNGMVVKARLNEYVLAARITGVSPARILLRHILPNIVAPLLVMLGRDLGGVILLEASLSFAGFGGNSIWGYLLLNGRNWILGGANLLQYWWVWLPATAAIILYSTGWNLLGDGIGEFLDPRRGMAEVKSLAPVAEALETNLLD
jgi:peptide/nickel transport system permease protein